MAYIGNKLTLLILIAYLFCIREVINPHEQINYFDVNENIIIMESDIVEANNDLQFKIIKDLREIVYNNQTYFLNSTVLLCQDESLFYYLYGETSFYNKTPYIENDTTIESVSKIRGLYNVQCFGCFKEIQYSDNGINNDIKKDEIIIYGRLNDKIFFFYYIDKLAISKYYNFQDILSCKLLISKYYICVYLFNNEIRINVAKIIINQNDTSIYEIDETINLFNEDSVINNLILYDTDKSFYKILCASNDNNDIKCCAIYVKPLNASENDDTTFESNIFELNPNYEASTFKKHKCYLTIFNSEFLLCCGGENNISCSRNEKLNFNFINKFSINLLGNIDSVIINTYKNYAVISYINETSVNNYLYQYYLIPQKCNQSFHNNTINIYSFGYFEIPLSQLIIRETNTRYFIRFNALPSDYGILKIDELVINLKGYLIEITPEMDKLSFTSNNYNTTNDFIIIYNIIIQETYYRECGIRLQIIECYPSCKGCFTHEANITNHYCKQCKEGYYHSPNETTNCLTKEEIEANFPHYYLDEENQLAFECHSECKTCYGSNYNNCLTCEEEKYLYNGECVLSCPNNTIIIVDSKGNNICKDCYPNCLQCIEVGNATDMKCQTCSEDKIRNDNNCYIVNDIEAKNFYDPEDPNKNLSCKETFGKYIIDNECIEIEQPLKGYFIFNNITGLLKPCHENCSTCSTSPVINNTNCDSCSYGLAEDGNCVDICSEGYYKNNSQCLKCHKNCLTCDTGMINNSEGKLINMKCTQCSYNMIKNEENCFPVIASNGNKIIFNISEIYSEIEYATCLFFNKSIYPGNNECIEKPKNTFYVLRNEDNTGVIKNCSKICDTCLGEESPQNTNCINCI